MIELEDGPDRAAVDAAAGGRLASLVVGGRERLVGAPGADAPLPSIAWGSFVMAPWVGRLRDATLEWGGRRVRLRRNFGGHAIHGVCFDAVWAVLASSDNAVSLATELDPAGWPFRGDVTARVELRAGRLDLYAEVAARDTMPVAIGWHPWFRREPGEPVRVQVDSDAVLETTPDLIPTGRILPVDPATDLRLERPTDELRLDHTYVRVRPPAVIAWPDLELRIGFDRPISTMVVYTAPGSVCLEPQTAWPDAPRLRAAGQPDTGLVVVEAGDRFTAHSWWEWRAHDTQASALAGQ